MNPPILRVALKVPVEAAKALGISDESFNRYVRPDVKLIRRGAITLVLVSELEQFLDIFGKHCACQLEFEDMRTRTESEIPGAVGTAEWNELAQPLIRPVPLDVRAFFKVLHDVCAESLNGTREAGGLRADEDDWLKSNTPDLRSKSRKLSFNGRRNFDVRQTGN